METVIRGEAGGGQQERGRQEVSGKEGRGSDGCSSLRWSRPELMESDQAMTSGPECMAGWGAGDLGLGPAWATPSLSNFAQVTKLGLASLPPL